MPKISRVEQFRRMGFDLSERIPFQGWRVRCSQCQSLVINGIPTHERGCPKQSIR